MIQYDLFERIKAEPLSAHFENVDPESAELLLEQMQTAYGVVEPCKPAATFDGFNAWAAAAPHHYKICGGTKLSIYYMDTGLTKAEYSSVWFLTGVNADEALRCSSQAFLRIHRFPAFWEVEAGLESALLTDLPEVVDALLGFMRSALLAKRAY